MRLRPDFTSVSFAAVLFAVMVALLIGPRVPNDRQAALCVVNVDLPGPFGFSLNCDSPEFMRLATHPMGLLEPDNTRQSRPGLVLAAAALTAVLSPLQRIANVLPANAERADIDPVRVSGALSSLFPAFVAYLLLNVVFLLWTFSAFRRICELAVPDQGGPEYAAIVVALGSLFLSNDMVKYFLWSPHTQILNILVPVLAVHALLWSWAGGMQRIGGAAAVGLATGVGIATYPLTVIVLPAVLMPLVRLAPSQPEAGIARLTGHAALLMAGCALPFAIWYVIVRFGNGAFYSHEFASGELVWAQNAYARGALLATCLENVLVLLRDAVLQAAPLGLALAWLIALVIVRRPAAELAGHWRQVAVACAAVSALTLLFYAAVGWISPRLAYSAVPPWTVTVGVLTVSVAARLDRRSRQILAAGCVVIAIGQMLRTILAVPALY